MASFNYSYTTQSQTIVIYGAPKTGKTESILALCRAGFKVHYIDVDHNVLVFRNLEPEFHENLNVFNMNESSPGAIGAALYGMQTSGKLSLCNAHGIASCPTCNANAASSYDVLDITKLTSKDVIVIDSYSQVFKSVKWFLTEHNKINMSNVLAYTIPFYQALSNTNEKIWNGICRLRTKANVIIISHAYNRADEVDMSKNKDGASKVLKPDGFYPIIGSKTFSSETGEIPISALIATRVRLPPVTRRTDTFNAYVPVKISPDAKTLGDILVEIISSNFGADTSINPEVECPQEETK